MVIDVSSHAYTTTVKNLKSKHTKLDILCELPLALIFTNALANVHLIYGIHSNICKGICKHSSVLLSFLPVC